jgi:hypothetical protein
MQRIKFIAILLFIISVSACSSSSNQEEAQEVYENDEIAGRWEMYYPVDDNSYFYFSRGGQYVYYNGDLLQQTKSDHYVYSSSTKTIHCEDSKGYSITIVVTFEDSEHATFVWNYDILSGKKEYNTIKVKRTSQQ